MSVNPLRASASPNIPAAAQWVSRRDDGVTAGRVAIVRAAAQQARHSSSGFFIHSPGCVDNASRGNCR